MTHLWQLDRGVKQYCVQTTDKVIAQKLRRRQGFHKSGTVILNKEIWIFNCHFARPDIAKKTLASVTGVKPKIDSEGVISYE